MDHAGIREMLSAYLDGELTPGERSLIEDHLKTCPECGDALRELRRTVEHIRELGEETPPPWLTRRVMARIQEEATREKILKRRFLHLRRRLPLQAAALVFLSVTVYMVYRTVSPEMKVVVPPVAEMGDGPVTRTTPPALPSRERELSRPVPEAKVPEKEKETGAPLSPKGRSPALPTSHEPAAVLPDKKGRDEQAPGFAPPPSPAPMAGQENASPPAYRERRGVDQGEDRGKEEKATPAMRTKAAAPALREEMRVLLVVDDAHDAYREIGRIAGLCGGAAVRWEVRDRGGVARVRLERERLGEFLDLLGEVGEARRKTPLPSGGGGAVYVTITVETEGRTGG